MSYFPRHGRANLSLQWSPKVRLTLQRFVLLCMIDRYLNFRQGHELWEAQRDWELEMLEVAPAEER